MFSKDSHMLSILVHINLKWLSHSLQQPSPSPETQFTTLDKPFYSIKREKYESVKSLQDQY
jgi:hypothetical protein